jgi:hypothetical protein
MIKECIPKPGFYSRPYNKDDTENKKPCKKVGFSQIKRVNKEDIKIEMEFDKEKALLVIKEMRRVSRKPKKKIIVLRKKKQLDDKPLHNGKSEVENKGSDNNK